MRNFVKRVDEDFVNKGMLKEIVLLKKISKTDQAIKFNTKFAISYVLPLLLDFIVAKSCTA